MGQNKRLFWLIFSGLMLFFCGFLTAQEGGDGARTGDQYARRFNNGAQLFHLQRWNEAAIEFRRAQESAVNVNDRSAALYWVILSQLAYSDYGSAFNDMDELLRTAPNSAYARDIVYHRARAYYNQGYYEDSILLFNNYINSTSDVDRESSDRRAAAYFWLGESLYAMGQLDEAEKFYAWVAGRYPESPKFEASVYRIDLIKQKKIEAELLALLQWSHEESLRTSEEHQRTIRTYEHTLNLYQRRIAELTGSVNNMDLENTENIFMPTQVPMQTPMQTPSQNEPSEQEILLERARQLGSNVEEILREHDGGGL
ncbi:MAG: hypothetical protein FWD28_04550 [Treponema sp.]|nr:hypothetical protein [Treponema sp.]